MEIECDPAKRSLVLKNRGLDMLRCKDVFSGATLTIADDRQDYGEPRFITIGYLDARMVVIVWTPRESAYRIISLRKANDREQAIYAPRLDRSR
jgi:uncharacterized protein